MLEELDIRNEKINIVPNCLRMLTNFQIFKGEETPLEIPPRHILESGAKAIV